MRQKMSPYGCEIGSVPAATNQTTRLTPQRRQQQTHTHTHAVCCTGGWLLAGRTFYLNVVHHKVFIIICEGQVISKRFYPLETGLVLDDVVPS